MRVTWTIVPLGSGKFHLIDHFGRQVAVVERKRDVLALAVDYMNRSYSEDGVDDIEFEGFGLIPFFPTRWLRKFREWVAERIHQFVR